MTRCKRVKILKLGYIVKNKRLDQASLCEFNWNYLTFQTMVEFENFQTYFSSARVNRYLSATNNSKNRAISLYKANLMISQAFYPLIGILEVILRNRLNDILADYFTDSDWIINQKEGFMSDFTLSYTYKRTGARKLNDFLKSEIIRVENRLQKSGVLITSGKIIAEQTFGFWTNFFEVHHYRLLKGRPIKIFKYLPPNYGRKKIIDDLNKVRKFRNRIYHNEPICFDGEKINFLNTRDVYKSLKNLLQWIDPTIITLLKELDKVLETIEMAESI
jgi:hypothetical protein